MNSGCVPASLASTRIGWPNGQTFRSSRPIAFAASHHQTQLRHRKRHISPVSAVNKDEGLPTVVQSSGAALKRLQTRLLGGETGMPPTGHFLSSAALYADRAVANSVSGTALSNTVPRRRKLGSAVRTRGGKDT